MEIDDEIKLRYLQAQRQVKLLAQGEATEGFVAENVEKEMQLFGRLYDDEAFDDWLSLGVPTTVESTIADADAKMQAEVEARTEAARILERSRQEAMQADAGGSWDELKSVLMTFGTKKKALDKDGPRPPTVPTEEVPQRQTTGVSAEYPVADTARSPAEFIGPDASGVLFNHVMSAAEETTRSALSKVNSTAATYGFDSISALASQSRSFAATLINNASANTQMLVEQVESGSLTIPRNLGENAEMTDTEHAMCSRLMEIGEALSQTMFEHELACEEAMHRINAANAPNEEAAVARDEFLAQCVDSVECHREVADLFLQIKLIRNCHHVYSKVRVPKIAEINEALCAMQAMMQDIRDDIAFPLRHDELEVRDSQITSLVEGVVNLLGSVESAPLSLAGHRQWQDSVLRAGFQILTICASQYTSLSVSEVNVGCSSQKAAERIREWVCVDGLTMSEVAFKQLRHDNFRIGIALCVSARFLLDELGATHDRCWGFSYW